MKYFRLIWSGLWRKRTRTIFTLLSIVMAFGLFGILQGVDASLKQLVEKGRLDILVTNNPSGLSLPLADFAQIQAVKGVKQATYESIVIGYHQTLANIVVMLAVDPDHYFDLQKGAMTVPPAQLAAFRNTRTGALITQALAQRNQWKVGDHVPLRAINVTKKDGTSDWTFDIVGYFDIPDAPQRDESIMLIQYPYFDTARATDTGTTQIYIEHIADGARAPIMANAIDNLFANSPNPTHTVTEKAFAAAAISQLGDLDFFVDTIVGAAFATLLLLTGTTLMQAYRERISEFAVMKTLGFTDWGVAALVLSEAILLSLGAAALGLLIAQGLLGTLQRLVGTLPGFHVPLIVLLSGAAAAVLLALLSALPPAWQARRLSIVNALAMR
jgi:putative ABC transport system permease protein